MTIEEAQSIIDLLGQPEVMAKSERELWSAQVTVDTYEIYMRNFSGEDNAQRRNIIRARYRKALTLIAADILARL